MRTFLRAHWKAIVAIVLLVLLATVTVNPRAMPAEPAPGTRLRAHVGVLAQAQYSPADAGNYIEHVLTAAGYAVRRQCDRDGACRLEAAVASVAPGARAARSFIVGAHYGAARGVADARGSDGPASDAPASAAAVLEVARLLKDLRPSPGTEIRFVFFLAARAPPAKEPGEGADADEGTNADADADADTSMAGGGSFVAYVGTLASSRQVQDALSAFQGVANLPPRGLAAPAYMQGVTLADRASWQQPGGTAPALVVTDTAFTRFPYRHADGADNGPDAALDERVYAGMARVVAALARTLTALAAGNES